LTEAIRDLLLQHFVKLRLFESLALVAAWYNFVRPHSTLKTTPAVAAGLASETRKGTAFVHDTAPTEKFWKAWRQDKDAVKAAGFSLRKYHDEWAVSYWSDREDCPVPESPT